MFMRKFGPLLLALLLVTLPLRGVASVLVPLCGQQQAPAAAMHDGCTDHGAQAPDTDGSVPPPSVHCSHCVACSGVAPMTPVSVTFASPVSAILIPFRHRDGAGHVPALPDRPPRPA